MLAEEAAQGVDARRAGSHPLIADPVQREELLLSDALHRHRREAPAAQGFQEGLGIRDDHLAGAHRSDVLWGQQGHLVARLLRRGPPEVRGATGLHDDMRRRLGLEKQRELPSGEAVASDDVPRAVRDRDFEDALCEIHGDGRRMHGGLLPVWSVGSGITNPP